MSARDGYYAAFPWTHPGRSAARIAGRAIEESAARWFSGRLIEIGCGTKAKSLLVGPYVSEHVGLDHPDSLHESSRVDLVASAYEIPEPSDSFDCALSTAVLEHLEEPQRALTEALRVLKPGAHAVYTTPFFWHLHEAPRDFFRYSRYGLEHLFSSAGFEVVEITALSGFWVTFGAELAYYIQRFRRGPLTVLVDAAVALMNLLAPRLDCGRLRDERFSWMHLVVARKLARPSESPRPIDPRPGPAGIGRAPRRRDGE
jgi:SAM-dependent methyltransferase